MSLHTFVGNTPIGTNRTYYGNAAPSAPDGNSYQIGDEIVNTPYPNGTALVAGTPVKWICTAGGVGGTAVFTEFGSDAQVTSAQFKHFWLGNRSPVSTTDGTDTAGIGGQVFLSEVFIGANVTLTGISFLIGSVGGTDKAIVILFNAAGAVLATSALAGVTVGTTATFQRLPFTTPIALLGSGKYYVGVQYNGTTAKLRTSLFSDVETASIAQTFGTPVAITPPATFTASVGPIAMTY